MVKRDARRKEQISL